eukprot:jgi/Mesen1/6549/ME000334S05883
MLARFLQAKKDESKQPKEKRPFLATECRDLADADKWRQQILREIGRKVMEIQNPGLGEHRLRDLNDEINKLIREKGHWEVRIVELGGPNYAKTAPKITDAEGNEVDIASGKGLGYKYFGAAKQLPGVKELFDTPMLPKKRRSRYEMYKRINADYYGYRDEEDGVLEKLERAAEQELREKAIREWQKLEAVKAEIRKSVKSGQEVVVEGEGGSGLAAAVPGEAGGEGMEVEKEDEDEERAGSDAGDGEGEGGSGAPERVFVAHVPLPDEKEIERMVLEKKKAQLMNKYVSENLAAEDQEVRELLNVKD